MNRLIIAGGGLAGGLAAMALLKRADVELILVEQQPTFGGNHTWSFFDSDVTPGQRWIVDDLVEWRWPDHEVHFPQRSRVIPIGYNSISSSAMDAVVKSKLRPGQYRLGATVQQIDATSVTLAGGERLEADAVIDARGSGPIDGVDLAWQKFVGRTYTFPAGHRVTRPVIMDAIVPQTDGYRFLYFLPLTRSSLLIEDTYYSVDPALDAPAIEAGLDAAAKRLNCGSFAVAGQESGVLPVVLDGDFDRFWPQHDQLPRLGVRGAFFHPTTSYSLPDAVANAAWLAEQQDFRPETLASALRGRARQLWNERAYFRLLNRLLFRAADPAKSYKVLEHFYRLPEPVIARFYAGKLTRVDKLRLLSGKPPVPIGRALKAMKRTTA